MVERDPTLKLEGGTFTSGYLTTRLTNSGQGNGDFFFIAAWYTICYDVDIVIKLEQVERRLKHADVGLLPKDIWNNQL
jgi:hypothetical protein